MEVNYTLPFISVGYFQALSELTAHAVQSFVTHPLTGAFSVSFCKVDVEPRQAAAIFSSSTTAEQKLAECHMWSD